MFMNEKESLKSIFELRSIIENVYFRSFERQLDLPVKLNHTHLKTMMILNFEGEKSMSVISEKVNLEKGSFTSVANTLIDLGFVLKTQENADRRVYGLKLTSKGEEFAVEYAKNHMDFMHEKLQTLTEDEKTCYFASIQIINNMTKKIL